MKVCCLSTFFYFGKLPYICFLKISKWVAQANVLSIHVSIGKIPFGDLLFAIVFHMKL